MVEEVRKIQLTGRSTFIVSLPKKWVISMGLRAGDQLVIAQEGPSLVITPKGLARPRAGLGEAVLRISENDTSGKIVRAIIAAYLNGYDPIRVVAAEGQIKPLHRNVIRDLVRKKLVGVEILSDAHHEMTLKVLVGYAELSIDNAFRRLYLITSSLLENALKALTTLDGELASNVIELDDEVDRMSFYIIRQLKVAVQDNKVMQEIGLSNPREVLAYRVLVKFVERIADHSAKIAEVVRSLKARPDESTLRGLLEMGSFAKSVFEASVEAFFKRDYQLAEEVVSKVKEAIAKEASLIKEVVHRAGDLSADVTLIVESLKRISDYSSDIAEIVLNLSIEQMLQN
jgi:phosphate uptake regulator